MQYEFYLSEQAYSKGVAHAAKSAELNLESLGLLTGRVQTYNGLQYTLATDYITAENDSTSVSVRFTPQAFADLASKYSGKGGDLIVGWMHSHPSYGCFLSQTDVKTQRTYFTEPFNVAVVIDPVESKRTGQAAVRSYKLDAARREGYREVSFAITRRKSSELHDFAQSVTQG